jgi:vancomycin resistance protein YoaR
MDHFRHLKRYKFNRGHIKFYAVLGILVFTVAYNWHYSDRFYPNTYVGLVSVGGMTYEEASAKILPSLGVIEENGFTADFYKEDSSLTVNIPKLVTGFTADTVVEYFSIGDAEKALRSAYERGREFPLLYRWSSKFSALFKKRTFEIPYVIHKEAIYSLLDRELNGFLKDPVNAEFSEVGGRVIIANGQDGFGLNYEDVLKAIENAISQADAENLRFEAKLTEPVIKTEDLEPLLDFANTIYKSVSLELWNKPFWWRVRGPILVSWLMLGEDGEAVAIRSDKLKNHIVANITNAIEGAAVNSRFEMRGGQLVEIVPGKSGLDVDLAKLESDLERELQRIYGEYRAGKVEKQTLALNLEIKSVVPRITKETVEQYKTTNLVGRAVTSFAGSSAARIKNIKVGVSKFNGVLIAPGEEFSAVEAIGYVNAEEGYEKEFVIKGDKSIKEYGGGLCQIATTLFRLALDAGLPITERKNHSYVVGYYGPGLDATIYGPHPDVRFVNDTNNYLLFQGYVEGTNLVMEFYGQKDGREVTISEPRIYDVISPPDTRYIFTDELAQGVRQCTERRRNGLTAEVNYQVKLSDSSVREQTFTSVYTPWQEVCLIGL